MKTYTLDRIIRIIIGLSIAIAILWLLNTLSNVLLPFFIGWLIAYLLYPTVKFFQYKCKLKSRLLSIITTLLLVFVVGIGCAFLLIPSIVNEFSRMGVLVVKYIQEIKSSNIS